MALLNYTTKIDADKTAHEISKCLSAHGASSIMTDYEDGVLSALSFRIKNGEASINFRLPCDWRPVEKVLDAQFPIKCIKYPNENQQRENERKLSERRLQAVRVSWRIVKDWVEAQMALVETNMVTAPQVFLPYAVMKNGQTLAQHIIQNPNLLLGDGN